MSALQVTVALAGPLELMGVERALQPARRGTPERPAALAAGAIADCNSNSIADGEGVTGGTSEDCNTNGVPDECEVAMDGALYGAPTSILSGWRGQAIVLEDFNGDSYLDFAHPHTEGGLLMGLNNGGGSFSTEFYLPSGALGPESAAAADLDGDGDVDLAIGVGSFDSPSCVEIVANNGDGTFAAPACAEVMEFPMSVELADLDGDGDPDLVLLSGPQVLENEASVLCGGGDSTFAVADPYPLWGPGVQATSLALGDLDGDAALDVAVASRLGINLLVTTSFVFHAGGDCNGNGAPDDCELAADSAIDCNANHIIDCCEINVALNPARGAAANDLNANGFLDECDFLGLSGCLAAPSKPANAGCGFFDYNVSGTIDLRDYAIYEASRPVP